MIHAVILAGGWGRRFWPKARWRRPKQILCLAGRDSPLQSLFKTLGSIMPKDRIWLVTNKAYAQTLYKHLPGFPKKNLLIEPLAKNTAAAIGWASVVIKRIDPQAVTVVLSSDQVIRQKKYLLRAIKDACKKAQQEDVLVTIGICPTRPATEYGYLRLAQKHLKPEARRKKIYKLEKFIEKPNLSRAKLYTKSKRYLWNSGMFVWKVSSILQAIKSYLPQLYSGLIRIEQAWGLPRYNKQLVKEYKRFKDISIDYGIMEQAHNIYTVAANFTLQDLGSWDNLAQGFLVPDKLGNVIQGLHKGIATRDSVIVGEKKHLIGTLGVNDLIIVHTSTATLVCRKDQAQNLKKLTQALEKDKHLRKYL